MTSLVCRLFDHLVGACQQRRRHRQAEGPSRLEIDDQVKLGRRLHRQIGRLLALENAIDVASRAPIQVYKVWPIGDQTAAGSKEAERIDRGQSVPGCKSYDQIAMKNRSPASGHD